MTSEENILAKAEIQLRTNGYHGFSFRDIARDTGLTSAGVHHHFPTKADLVVRLAETYKTRFLDALDACPAEGRVACLRDLFAKSLTRDGHMCLCGLLAAESGGLPDAVAQSAHRFFDDLADRLHVAFPASDDPRAEALNVLAQLEGAALLATVRGDPALFEVATQTLAGGSHSALRH
ncbi:MAG: TetR/AcrR family transcriptional regulator [Pseudomonadota bacterium]